VTPAPRLSETPGIAGPSRPCGDAEQRELLTSRGIGPGDIAKYQESGALHLPPERPAP
jgi:hypothetical protein